MVDGRDRPCQWVTVPACTRIWRWQKCRASFADRQDAEQAHAGRMHADGFLIPAQSCISKGRHRLGQWLHKRRVRHLRGGEIGGFAHAGAFAGRRRAPFRHEFVEAVEVAERAFALEARAAVEIEAEDVGRSERRREAGRRGAVKGDDRPVERGSNMHQAGVVADDQIGRASRSTAWPSEVAPPGCRRGRGRGRDFVGDGAVLGRPEQPDGVAVGGQLAGQRVAKCVAGQRLAGPYSAPGQKATKRLAAAERRQDSSAVRPAVDRICGMGEIGAAAVRPGFRRAGRNVRPSAAGRICRDRGDIDQAVARFAGKADVAGCRPKKGISADFSELGGT